MKRIVTNEHNLEVLYEDNHLFIINKRPGDIVQGDNTGDTPISEYVKRYLKKKYDKPGNVFAGVVHRLDRPTSGVLILAKTSKALSRMNALFRSNEVQKTYWALSDQAPKDMSGQLVQYLKKNEKRNRSTAFPKPSPGAKESILGFNVLSVYNKMYLFELHPKTGRHHQIRVQLSTIGSPILGDVKYGSKTKTNHERMFLHAKKIEFLHPTRKEKMTIEAPLGDEKEWDSFR